jgi:hypothetical protein
MKYENIMADELTEEQLKALYEEKPPPLATSAALGLRECLRIEAERAASPAWNNRADAGYQRYKLTQAIEALRIAATITYFETN